ncbi:MAG: HD domain-containing protein [Chloroflexota bacterium]|nr:HD domain-containing protein [Chloroflexota bacterium]
MPSTKRIRDPIHGLIRFEAESEVDQLAWRLLDAPEMQRLRSIKQLGFLHLVFPGATHTRFGHSVGVYHVARQLLGVIRRELGPGSFDERRARVLALAALLHDIGHGPLSHVFEKSERAVGGPGNHEHWSRAVLCGDTAVRQILDDAETGLAGLVADEICGDGPDDIYASVVASHFDADRLDYLQRDRRMTGVASGSIDLTWLLDSLRVESLADRWGGGRGLVLASKGLRSAEEYLLARINLYRQVYLHKTSRGAELMLEAAIVRLAELIADGSVSLTGLTRPHPLLDHVGGPRGLASFLSLDDEVLGGALAEMATAGDVHLAELASRLRRRRIFKCFDAGERIPERGLQFSIRFRARLRAEAPAWGLVEGLDLLSDEAAIDAISSAGPHGPGSQRAVLVKPSPNGAPVEITKVSKLVASIAPERVLRFYVPGEEDRTALARLWDQLQKEAGGRAFRPVSPAAPPGRPTRSRT